MALIPLTDCSLLLGIDPKTLRLWLTQARLCPTSHPTDARLKCLTEPHLHQLATLHGRVLPSSLAKTASAPVASTPEPLVAKACSCELSTHPDLRHQFTQMQTQVASLQEQVTHLALVLLRQRDWAWEAQPPVPLPTLATNTPMAPSAPAGTSPLKEPMPKQAAPAPSPARSGSRVLPLIEYGADGTYRVICPTQGVLSLTPDSPQWFDWLASLTSFTFQGANGRFSTTRKLRNGQRIQTWNAYRSLHGRSCTLYLGFTSHLTLARLEQMATNVHSRLTSF